MGMVVFSDKKTEYIEKVQETFRAMGREAEIIVLEDDGFLPEGTSSPYEFFAYKDHQGELAKKDVQLKHKDAQLTWQETQTESHILNFIRQYKKDEKTKTQTRLALQEVFSFMPSDAEEKIEKYW